jgi:hypothetical protein
MELSQVMNQVASIRAKVANKGYRAILAQGDVSLIHCPDNHCPYVVVHKYDSVTQSWAFAYGYYLTLKPALQKMAEII